MNVTQATIKGSLGFPEGDPSLERGHGWYDDIYQSKKGKEKYEQRWNQSPLRTITWYPALVLAEPPIFEVGCGPGHFAAMCRDFGVAYAKGIDASEVAIGMAREMVPSSEFFVKNGSNAKGFFQTDDYRTCVLIEVLEHIYRDLELIRMVPNGRAVVLTVPSFHTEGHVRWFSSKKQVMERYSEVLKISEVVQECISKKGNRWWILKGIRQGEPKDKDNPR